jgi:alkaline phosphatase D
MKSFSRREFLKITALATSTMVISTGLTGCGSSNKSAGSFKHGVASGDPLSDRAIIWTRVTPSSERTTSVDVIYQVAADKDFANLVHDGTLNTSSDQDFTVKIDVLNLEAGSTYYYRFIVGENTSLVGRLKTLPTTRPDQVKMAIFSCSNYPNGHFNPYMEASLIEDLDVTLHLGDYIYEYGMYENDDFTTKKPAYATKNAQSIGRVLPENNNTECVTLNDYRLRYALYHTDAGNQAIHQACPMIVVWDDHEVANDTYKDGAQNHDESEGSFAERTQAALQAYFEWLPIRPVDEIKKIYRTFDFGGLVALHMLETRLIARDKQLSYTDYYTPDFDSDAFVADLTNPSRTMLGAEQLGWLQAQLATSSATWQAIGQQVLMGRMNLPVEILSNVAILESSLSTEAMKEEAMAEVMASLSELAAIKTRILQGDTTVTAEERARIETTLPYNLDAWDGYFAEREVILGTAKAYNRNLVVFSGDTHNSWANELKDMHGDKVGVEFAGTSVSSPGMEEYLGISSLEMAMQFEQVIALLVDDLKYCNLNNRGFMLVTFTQEQAISQWYYVDNNNSANYTILAQRSKELTTPVDSFSLIEA